MQQIDNLTGVRAFAALAVMMLHLRYPPLSDAYGHFAFLFNYGALGVEVFFVLSGFILAYVHRGDFLTGITAGAARSFLWARLARIYPVHLFELVVVAFVLPTAHLFYWGPTDTWTTLATNLLLVHGWGLPGLLTFNQPSWSISAEWFAYLCFPLLVFLTRRWHFWRPIALIALLMLIMPFVFYTIDVAALNCALLFTIGLCTFIIGEQLPKSWFWRSGGIMIGPLLIFLLWLQPPRTHDAFVMLSALLILCLFKGGPVFAYANPVSVYLGRISYSIYMSHIITLWTVRGLAHRMLPLYVEIPAVIIVAALIFHIVEEPARNWMRGSNRSEIRSRIAHFCSYVGQALMNMRLAFALSVFLMLAFFAVLLVLPPACPGNWPSLIIGGTKQAGCF
jgi:peptidoglycan/LPS O-acetylase OafA/YrhL